MLYEIRNNRKQINLISLVAAKNAIEVIAKHVKQS